jgi:hypothetical protein
MYNYSALRLIEVGNGKKKTRENCKISVGFGQKP